MGLFAIYAVVANWRMPTEKFSMSALLVALQSGIWALFMPFILLGGIYSGYSSPTEAAAVALVYSVLIELFIHKELSFRDLKGVVLDAVKLGGALFPLIAVTLSLNLILIENRLPDQMVDLVEDWITSPVTFIIIVNLLLLAVRAVMTTAEAVLTLAPIAAVYGLDKVIFGVIMIINLEIGLLTPPVGLNLIVAMSTFKQKFIELVRAAVPFILLMILALGLIAWLPEISPFFVG